MAHYGDEERERFQDIGCRLYEADTTSQPTEEEIAHMRRMFMCTDVLPGGYCEMMDMRHGTTYAAAARHVLRSHNVPPKKR